MKLSDVCDVYSGYAFKKFNDLGHGVPVIKISNLLSDGSIDLINCLFTTENFKEKFYSKKNDIYIALSGATTGKVGIMDKDDTFVINQRVGIVRNRSTVPNEYLKYFLMSKSNRILEEASGCAQPNISPKQIADYDVPIFSDAEMIKIVSELREIDKVKSIYQRQLELLDELVKARFVEMFGDPVSNSKDLPIQKMNNVAPICQYDGSFEERVWLLNLDMVESQTGRIINYNIVGKDAIGGSVCTFDENNILYSKLRPYLNKVVIPNGKGYATSELVPLRPDNKIINRIYLAYLLRSNEFVEMIKEKVAGAKMPRASMSDFREFNVPVPPLELQNQFASFVEEIDKSRLLSNHSLSLIKSIIF